MNAISNSPNFALSISSQKNDKRLSEKKIFFYKTKTLHNARGTIHIVVYINTTLRHHTMLQDWMTLGNANTSFSKGPLLYLCSLNEFHVLKYLVYAINFIFKIQINSILIVLMIQNTLKHVLRF